MEGHSTQAEVTLFHWRLRFATLVAGAVIAGLLVWGFWGVRRGGGEAALGRHQHTHTAVWDGHVIAARLQGFGEVYPPSWWSGEFALWLGNSQMHTINQYEDGDETAPYYASEALGWPAICLSMENASFQEFLVATAWAMGERTPDWLVIPLVYDDLREDGLRTGLEALVEAPMLELLKRSTIGGALADQLVTTLNASRPDNVTANPDSLQDRTEAGLERLLGYWVVWRSRGDVETAVQLALYRLRNWVLRINPSTKRRMVPLRYERNMEALNATLDLAREGGVRVLVYIAPLRQEPEPPYHMSQYAKWKEKVRALAEEKGALFADLDSIVPAREWGTLGETEQMLDFMHFRVGGHEILGARVAELLRSGGGKDER